MKSRLKAALARPELRHEWHQFRLLSRDSVRRLLDSVLVARDADPMLFALWFMALAMTPPLLVAAPKFVQYAFLKKAPAALVLQIATAERAFFILYGMLATALLAALTWDALFPDRTDQEIVGALPVRPRTLAAARLAAALALGRRSRPQSVCPRPSSTAPCHRHIHSSGLFRACWPLTSSRR